MSVLIDSNTPDLIKSPRKPVSAHKINARESIKRGSVVRRTKKSLSNQNFRHSIHDIAGALNELNLTEDEKQQQQQNTPTTPQRPEKARVKRSRSFHVSEDHVHNINQRERCEILKQYISTKLDIDIDTLEKECNSDNVPKLDPTDGTFSIHNAIQQKYEKGTIKELSFLLLKNENINIEQQNNEGQTPLQYAVSLELHEVVRLLVAFGASVNCKDNYGESPLRYAVDNGDFEMASLLISHGANATLVQNGFWYSVCLE